MSKASAGLVVKERTHNEEDGNEKYHADDRHAAFAVEC